MNKSELIDAVAAKTENSKAATGEFLDALVETIRKTLKRGEEVRVAGFGSFTVRKRAARTGRNPRTGQTIKIKASKSPAFKAAKAFKDGI